MCMLSFDPQNIHMKQATVTVQYKVEETKVKGNWAKVTQLASGRAGTRARPPKSRKVECTGPEAGTYWTFEKYTNQNVCSKAPKEIW